MYKILKNFIDIDKYCLQRLSLPTSNSGSGTNFYLENTIENPLKINLKASESTQDGEPTPESPQDIHVVKGDNEIVIENKNLFDKNNANIINCAVNAQPIQISANAKSIYIKITGGKTYTISKIASARLRAETTIQTPEVGVSVNDYQENDSATSLTIQTSASAKYLLVYYYLSGTDTLTEQQILDSIQIEEGTTQTPYVEHQEQNYTLTLGNVEFCSINNYSDEIFKNVPECEYYDDTLEYGKWYKYGRIDKIVLDGTEEWRYNSTSSGNYRYYLNQNIGLKEPASTSPSTKALILSNKFKAVSANDTWVGTTGINTIESITQYPYARLCLCYVNENTNTTEKFKNWLSTNNVIVYYPLAIPTKTLLSDTLQTELDNIEENAKTYHGITNINQVNDDNSFILDIEYITQNLEV